MKGLKRVGYNAVWIALIIYSIILLLDRESGVGTYIGCAIMIIGSIVVLYVTYKKRK